VRELIRLTSRWMVAESAMDDVGSLTWMHRIACTR